MQYCALAGLHEVGIFRLPGQASRIQALKELYDSGSQEDFSTSEDMHTVASLLKLYLRELPEPVVPFGFYESYREALKGAQQFGLNMCACKCCSECRTFFS